MIYSLTPKVTPIGSMIYSLAPKVTPIGSIIYSLTHKVTPIHEISAYQYYFTSMFSVFVNSKISVGFESHLGNGSHIEIYAVGP